METISRMVLSSSVARLILALQGTGFTSAHGTVCCLATQAAKPGAKAAKPSQINSKKKPVDAYTEPRQAAAIQMLMHHRQSRLDDLAAGIDETSQQLDAETAERIVNYQALKQEQYMAWKHGAKQKFLLQREALRCLPPELRALASQPDLTPNPPNRQFYLDRPPAAYMQPSKQTSEVTDKHQSGGDQAKSDIGRKKKS